MYIKDIDIENSMSIIINEISYLIKGSIIKNRHYTNVGGIELVKYLLAYPDMKDIPNNERILFYAITENDVPLVRVLLADDRFMPQMEIGFGLRKVTLDVNSPEMAQLLVQDYRYNWTDRMRVLKSPMNPYRYTGEIYPIYLRYEQLKSERIAAVRLVMGISLPESFYESLLGLRIRVWV